MADSIKFTIGGQLGPSYRGALAQAEVEALRANNVLNTKIHAQQARIAALDKAYSKVAPGSAEASALAIQQYPKRMAMEKELQLMMLKSNLTASANARKLEAEKVAAATTADAELIAANKAKLATIMAQEREAGIAEAAIQDAIVAQRIKDEAEKVAAAEAANLAILTTVATGGGAGIAGGHGRASMTGIIRESLTIVREIAAGRGAGRIAGSVTLLAQYMGLLGKVVKSTAQEQLMAADAASTLSQAMSAQALAAKGTAAFTELETAALAQEEVAVQAVTRAQIALQTAKVSINPLGWVLISGVIIAGILFAIGMHMHTLAMRAKNLADLLDPLKKKFSEMADAMRDNAKEHQEYLDWLKKVGQEHETLPEKIDKVIRKMREQAQAEMELARLKGRSRVELERMEEAQLKAELMIVTRGKLQAQRESEDAQMKADESEKSLQAFNPAISKMAEHAAKNAGEILDAIQEKMEKDPDVLDHWKKGLLGPEAVFRKATSADPLNVKAGNKSVTISLDQAKAAYNNLSKLSDHLAANQKKLQDTLANDKLTVEEKRKSVKTLTDEQQRILDELGIKQTTGREIARISGNRGRVSQNEMERSGLFQSSALIRTHDTLIESLKVQKKIERNTQRGTRDGHSPGGVHF